MPAVLTLGKENSLGYQALKIRIFLGLQREELANLASVSIKEVSLFEHNLPVRLDAKRKLIRELLARKAIR
jgi:transcriptional regulator with XRE-family HTH domain